jgi:cytochrome P450
MRFLERVFRSFFGSRMKPFEGIPGPTPTFPFGTLLDFWGAKPWDVCAAYGKRYGGITLIWVGEQPALVLNDPALIREVLVTNWKDYYKDNPVKAFKPVLKKTVFDQNGPEWVRMRINHPLSMEGLQQWLPSQASAIEKVVEGHLKRLCASQQPVDLLGPIERMCYDLYNACVVGRQLGDRAYRDFYITSNMATRRMVLPKWLLVPPLNPMFWIARHRHFGAFEEIIKETKQDLGSGANDLLHNILRKGTGLSDKELADEVGDIHAGGVFSAGTALVNTLYLLSRHPRVAQEIYDQLRALPRHNSDFAASSLEQCPLVEHVLRESMRYLAPVPVYFRNVLKSKSTRLGDRTLPPNTLVLVVTQAAQHSTKFWENPDTFDPSRWQKTTLPLDSDYFFPFGRGPRICVGATFAMFCMKVMLASLLSRARIEIDSRVQYQQFFHCGVAEPKGIVGRFIPHQ